MRPFRAQGSIYEQSIAIDASTIDGITVTVAVEAQREDELDILNGIYTASDGYDFYPFRNKSHDLEYQESIDLFDTVIDANGAYLTATAHLGNDGSNPERVEAVQSAVLAHQLASSDKLVILDGDEDKADRFGSAIAGIADEIPPVTTCIKSELYYPTSLLADLCASHLAYTIDHPRHCSNVVPEAPETKTEYADYWGQAYSSMVTQRHPVEIEPITQRNAQTVPRRIDCWFNGYMGGGKPHGEGRSVKPIVEYTRQKGYDELARRLSEV